MKATKKPVTIDFIDSINMEEIKSWAESFGDKFNDHFVMQSGLVKLDNVSIDMDKLMVKTLEGTSYEVTDLDVIIRGIKGEYYPCKKDIFEATYDLGTAKENVISSKVFNIEEMTKAIAERKENEITNFALALFKAGKFKATSVQEVHEWVNKLKDN